LSPERLITLKKMKKTTVFLTALLLSICSLSAQVEKILGDWSSVDDKTGEVRSVVHIYKGTDGKYYGKIAQLLLDSPDSKCIACTGADKDKPVIGLIIIRGFEEKDGKLVGGRVLDPDNGKFYYGKIYMKGEDLVLRGSLDKAGVLGRSQTWKRKK